jgi:integration host factor subunit alpha
MNYSKPKRGAQETMPKTAALTKADIIRAIAATDGFTRKKAAETVEIVLKLIKKALESGDDALVSGFGKFCLKHKKERRGRNPSTSKDLLLRPRRVITFRTSRQLRKKINQL